MKTWLIAPCALLLLVACGTDEKKSNRVLIPMSLPAKLDLSTYDNVVFPGFISDVENEFFVPEVEAVNYFRRELVRRDVIDVVEMDIVDLKDKDPRAFFEREQPFFSQLPVEAPGNTLAVTGVVSFEARDLSRFQRVQDRAANGRVYYRTQFVEMTGFELNIRVLVYEMESGKMLYRETLSDRMDIQGKEVDQRLVYYDLLNRVSGKVVGLFSNTVVRDERILK